MKYYNKKYFYCQKKLINFILKYIINNDFLYILDNELSKFKILYNFLELIIYQC